MSLKDDNTNRLRLLLGSYWFMATTISLANELAKRHDVMYITSQKAINFDTENNEYHKLFDKRINLRVERSHVRKNPMYYVDRIVGLKRGLYSFQPDVFHFQESFDTILHYLIPKLSNVPFVLTVHDPLPHLGEGDKYLNSFKKRKSKIFALRRRADHIITLADNVKKQLLEAQPELSPDRISVVPHFPMKHMLYWKNPDHVEKPGTILFFGRINAYKGLGVMLDAWKIIREKCPNSRLVIAGSGNDLINYKDQILSDNRCQLIEQYIPVKMIAQLFSEASVLVLPYLEATQSGPLSTAIAFGTPVVATNVGGLPEMIDNEQSGLIVPPNDPKAISNSVIRIIQNDEFRAKLREGALQLNHKRFSAETLTKKTEDIYKQAIYYNKSARCKQ